MEKKLSFYDIVSSLFTSISHFYFILFFFSILLASLFFIHHPAYASHSISVSTADSMIVNTSGGGEPIIQSSNIQVITDCRAGYTLTMNATSSDNYLYPDGDASYRSQDNSYIAPSDGVTALKNAPNTYGYLISETTPTRDSVFLPVPTNLSTPATLKTPTETASDTDINDTFPIYIGISLSLAIRQASYRMPTDGSSTSGFTYLAVIEPSCDASLDVTFYPNTSDGSVENLPSSSEVIISGNTATLPSTTPTRAGYTFTEWNTSQDGTGDTFYPGGIINIGSGTDEYSGSLPLYAIWTEDCPANYICYNANHASVGTMTNQSATSNTNIVLIASNFNRVGYGFAGWNTSPDGTGTNYGPDQTINPGDLSTTGLTLYAKWIKSSGSLQAWDDTSSMNVGDVIALRDTRDSNTYAVAKLADNNIWLIENLRLDPGLASITTLNTNNPTSTFITQSTTDDGAGNPVSLSTTSMCGSDGTTCDDQIQYNANNLDRSLTQSHNSDGNNKAWYGYGIYYNWYTATAGNGTYATTSGNVAGDLCPAGWRLPTGNTTGEYQALNLAINNGSNVTNSDSAWRTYPNNFVWGGDYNKTTRAKAYNYARLWTSTSAGSNNAYRAGLTTSEVTVYNKSFNKWDGFNVRCIYQGGTSLADVTVSFPSSGVSSLTFTNNNYGTETATPESPYVTLVENATYTITANVDSGYELNSWATTANGTLGDSTTTNPATNPNTYTVTDDATLTMNANVVPPLPVTVHLDEHVTSISFNSTGETPQIITTDGDTVSLRRGTSYTIAASFDEGYTIDQWATTSGGILGSTTSASTTYTISSATTLSLTSKEAELLTYTLHYDVSNGSGTPADDTKTSYNNNYQFIIDTTSIPTLFSYHFIGYSETSGSSTAEYAYNSSTGIFTPSTITVTNPDPGTSTTTTKTLYAVYVEDTCPAGYICYFDNGADSNGGGIGTMANQSASSNSSATLIPSNYSKTGYGFAGWLADPGDETNNIPPTVYGPNQTITTGNLSTSGLKLYAYWIASVGNLQTWNGCNAMTEGSVTALTDTRDNQTYAVAKLADDNCWIVENLRLDPGLATITTQNTHNPTSTFITQSTTDDGSGNPVSLSTTTLCNTNDSTCFDQIQLNANSLDRTLTQSYTNNDAVSGWYSYGVYYNWYTATAGNGVYDTTSTSGSSGNGTVDGDLCPKNWHLPSGNSTGEYNALNTAINSGTTNTDAGWRTYPANFIRSGDYNTNKRTNSNSNARLWTATAAENNKAYRVGFDNSSVTSATNTYNKWDGFIVRCIRDEGTAEYSDVTVTFPQNVTSITFTNARYGTETATPSNPTVSLAENATYTITANFALGYELNEWSNGANSTIGSTTTNPTTFIITDDTTLILTVNQIPSYTVTVNFDEHVSSIGFYNATYGTQQVTLATATDNQDGTYTATVTLYNGIQYTLSSSYNTGYQIDHWTTTANGTLGSTTSAATTYTIIGTATLSLTSEQLQPPTTCNTPVPNITYMQDITSSNYNTVMNSLTTDAPYYLRDSRDGEPYCVSKLQDGNLWLLDNLRLDLTDSTTLANTTASNTNASTTSLNYLKNGGGTVSDKYAITGVVEWTDSPSYASRYSYSDPLIATSGDCNDYDSTRCANDPSSGKWTKDSIPKYNNTETKYGPGSGKIGIYYNYCAASAGSYCYGNGTSSGSPPSNTNATEDLCPANWRMPTGGSSGEYQSLCTILNGGTICSNSQSMYTNPNNSVHKKLSTPLSGIFYNNISSSQGSFGYFWSSTYSSSNSMNELMVQSNYMVSPQDGIVRNRGLSMRCLFNQPSHSVTVSLDSNISSVTFSDGTNTQTATSASPTVSLVQGKQYTINATTTTGYEFSSWSTTANGTLGSTTANPTTYTVSDTATLTATSQAIPTYTTTVNFAGTGISSVGFYNADYGTQTVSTSGGTVSLRHGVPYTITASTSTGNRFVNFATSSNGTLVSTSTNPTTYTIMDDTTLTITGEAIPTYNINVTFDEHVSSIGFYHADYGTQQVTPANSTDNGDGTYTSSVTMYDNIEYTLSSSYTTGYQIDHWSTTANGTLGSTTSAATTYTVTGTATLSLTSEPKPVAKCTASIPNINITYMQDITSANKSVVLDNMTSNVQYSLKDNRDNKTYCIAKLADGNIWMTQNLDLEIGGRGVATLTSDNTNLTTTTNSSGIYNTDYTTSGSTITWQPTPSNTNATVTGAPAEITNFTSGSPSNSLAGWVNDYNKPYMAEGGDNYVYTSGVADTSTLDIIYNSIDECTAAGHSAEECAHYHVGNYYNWTAAIASSASNNIGSTQYAIAANSICPKGWRLPKGYGTNAVTREFGELWRAAGITDSLTATSYATNGFLNIRQAPLFFTRGGIVRDTTFAGGAISGDFWSSSVYSSNNAYIAYITGASINSADYNGVRRYFGAPIRCIVGATD